MEFKAQDYFNAATERWYDSEYLRKDEKSIIFAIYSAGLAVECLLRAFINRKPAPFNSRHNLRELYLQSKMSLPLSSGEQEKLDAAVSTAGQYWFNNLRFTSVMRLKRHLLDEIIRENPKNLDKFLKHHYNEYFDQAHFIMKTGVKLWN